jgi:hypothetical protein
MAQTILKYTHVFDMVEKILCFALAVAVALGVGYLLIPVHLLVGLGAAAAAYFGGRILFTKLLKPVSTFLYLFFYCGTIISYTDAAKVSFLLDGSLGGQWWTLLEIRNIPFKQRREILYQFAESKGAPRFERKKKTETNQTNTTNQNTTTQQEAKPTTPQYTEQYVKACSLFDLKPTFSESELKTSYHKMMKQYHPDLYATAAPEIKDFVEGKSRELIASYNYLLEDMRNNGN